MIPGRTNKGTDAANDAQSQVMCFTSEVGIGVVGYSSLSAEDNTPPERWVFAFEPHFAGVELRMVHTGVQSHLPGHIMEGRFLLHSSLVWIASLDENIIATSAPSCVLYS